MHPVLLGFCGEADGLGELNAVIRIPRVDLGDEETGDIAEGLLDAVLDFFHSGIPSRSLWMALTATTARVLRVFDLS